LGRARDATQFLAISHTCLMPSDSSDAINPKPASVHTSAVNAAHGAMLNFDDPGDWERATRGLIASHPTGVIHHGNHVAWDIGARDFLRGPEAETAPDTVHPSLWRQGRLNSIHGLFEVADGVWQARGYDISNLTFIAGDSGWVLVDVLTSGATAAACLELANRTLGHRPVTAVIYTHSHADHFGGILGVTSEEAVAAGDVRIIAPEGFLREAVSENIIAGPAMARRSGYMFGSLLPASIHGHVDSGLGVVTPSAPPGLIAPTEEVATTGTELDVDGIRIVFQNTPGGEAPAEMNFLFPDKRLLCMAENCTHTMHNALTPRGAQVRDTLGWSKYINEALDLFIDQTETLFSTHHWPRFGQDDAREFLIKQRDMYRWLHDQTMRLANHGHTATEIAEQLKLPDCFSAQSHTREYYGTVSHNSKAVYQRYLGWFDGNPANLNPHPPEASGRRYVDAIGGSAEVLRQAEAAMQTGDYRWAAQLLNHLVFAEPDNQAARLLQADTFEQLGYQAESGPWRNFYLTGAMELRAGGPQSVGRGGRAMTNALTIDMIFDALGVRLQAEAVEGKTVTLNWQFPDIDERHVLGLSNCALHHRQDCVDEHADATLTLDKRTLGLILTGSLPALEAIEQGLLRIEGDGQAVLTLLGSLDQFEGNFAISEP